MTDVVAVAELNMRLQPTHRRPIEDAWDEFRLGRELPEIIGGGTAVTPRANPYERTSSSSLTSSLTARSSLSLPDSKRSERRPKVR